MTRITPYTTLLLIACGKPVVQLEAGPPPAADTGLRQVLDVGPRPEVDAGPSEDAGGAPRPDAGRPEPVNPFEVVGPVPLVTGTIDGQPYRSAVPTNAHGLAFYFHDSGKDETALARVEVQDLILRLNQRLIAVVALRASSGEPRRWDVSNLTAGDNRDWNRLVALRNQLVATTDLGANGPVYAVGQGNGGTFATLFAYLAEEAGWSVPGALVHGAPIAGGWVTGAYNPRTAFVLSENDEVAQDERLLDQLRSLDAREVPYTLLRCEEKSLHRWRFTRIPGVDPDTSEMVFWELRDLGIIDREGERLVPISEAWIRSARHPFWPDVIRPHLPAIEDQLRVVWAARTFCGNHLGAEIRFLLP